MIVEYVKGNAISLFLEGKYHVFAHGCNIFNRMGSGIAKEVRERLPELWHLDQNTVEGDRTKLGKISGTSIAQKNSFGTGINMYTQATFWDPTDMLSYDAVKAAFSSLNDQVLSAQHSLGKMQKLIDDSISPERYTMCIPMIGAGLARGDWSKISAIINEVTPDVDITVVEFDGSK